MKVALNQKPYDGPWGGGNRFVKSISEKLQTSGHEVVYDLHDTDIDIILIIDPRFRSPRVTFTPFNILIYLLSKKKDTLVIQRINDCDKRKGKKNADKHMITANYVADYTVFVGSWLKDLPQWKNIQPDKWSTIMNGVDNRIFNADGHIKWDRSNPFRLVTHHWSYNPYKGFDVYSKIDDLLDTHPYVEMAYIGRIPQGFRFRNIRHVPPLDGMELADELRKSHAYLTASLYEPGGNHQSEGIACGLPVVYRNSGSLPEYCEGYGVHFDGPDDVMDAIQQLINEYDSYDQKVKDFDLFADRMVLEYISLFETLINHKEDICHSRNLFRNPYLFLRNLLPLF